MKAFDILGGLGAYGAIPAIALLIGATAAQAATNRQEYPYPKAAVYRALLDELRAEKRKIKDEDPLIGRVSASAGISAMSWGENLSFAVVESGPTSSAIKYASARKVGTNIMDGGRGFKIFDKVVLGVSRRLQAAGPPQPDPEALLKEMLAPSPQEGR